MREGVKGLIAMAIVEIIGAILVFGISYYRFIWGGKGNGFKIYVLLVCIINLIIALSR